MQNFLALLLAPYKVMQVLFRKNSLIKIYITIASALFLVSFIYSQSNFSIEEVRTSNPIEYLIAANANWQTENEIYFNAKSLNLSYDHEYLGLYEAGKACGKEYCYKFNIQQLNTKNLKWYPSASGIDADLFLEINRTLYKFHIPITLILFMQYFVYFALSTVLVILLIQFVISSTRNYVVKILQFLVIFSPWILFTSMSVTFSLGFRFLPIIVILLLLKKGSISSSKVSRHAYFWLSLSVFISTLHGFEFSIFIFALVLVLPYPINMRFRTILSYNVTSFFYGALLAITHWISILFLNTKDFKLSMNILFHTFFKQTHLLDIDAPLYAIDSGYNSVSITEGLFRFIFQTSFLFPHPFPEQVSSLIPEPEKVLWILAFITSYGFLTFALMLESFRKRERFKSNICLSLIFTLLGAFLLHDYVYFHRHFMGTVIALNFLIITSNRESSIMKRKG